MVFRFYHHILALEPGPGEHYMVVTLFLCLEFRPEAIVKDFLFSFEQRLGVAIPTPEPIKPYQVIKGLHDGVWTSLILFLMHFEDEPVQRFGLVVPLPDGI